LAAAHKMDLAMIRPPCPLHMSARAALEGGKKFRFTDRLPADVVSAEQELVDGNNELPTSFSHVTLNRSTSDGGASSTDAMSASNMMVAAATAWRSLGSLLMTRPT
jgi:hypothetical protein